MYCLTTRDEILETIKSLGYLPVMGFENIKSSGFLRDNYNHNIFKKNDYYGEYYISLLDVEKLLRQIR